MGLFKSQFNDEPDKQLFHSSGVLGSTDAETLGATSTETFEQRRQLRYRRKLIDDYKSAGVMHSYRLDAKMQQSRQSSAQPASQDAPSRTAELRSSTPARIDVIKAPKTRHSNRGAQGAAGTSSVARPAPRAFSEPSRRSYNPYQ